MVWTIARKQLLNNLLTYKFLVGLVLCLVLFSLSAVVLTRDYEERLAGYNSAVSHHAAKVREAKVYSQVTVTVDRHPALLSPLCEGFEKRFATSALVSYTDIPTLSAGQAEKNPLMLTLKSIDLVAIIQIVLGLLTLLFAYDSFSGERERGVLALTLSNRISRASVLLGQYLGGILTILPLLLMGIAVAALILLFSPVIVFQASDWLFLGSITFLSLIYLSALFLIGMLFSIVTKASSTSLVVVLFFWVLFVILIPNASAHLAHDLRPIQAKYLSDAQARELNRELYKRIDFYTSQHPMPVHKWEFIKDREVYSGGTPYPVAIYFAPREVMVWELEGLKFCLQQDMDYAEKAGALYRDYELSLASQANLASYLGKLSPARLYYDACAVFAGTDSSTLLRFFSDARDYRRALIRYVQDKNGLLAAPYFTRADVEKLPTTAELDAVKTARGQAAVDSIIGPGFGSVPPLDLRDMPNWDPAPEQAGVRAARALPNAGTLVFLNLLFFLAAHVAFLRADVRAG
jgi:ABC-type transport system involved in multi-copper enzyme maturation permease subunit